ncbi:predicted protein [Plenodomus lingam JN3]|uniref:Uncharacterized protein n=1 Tax=Leptosphaeria maculans (strain JN3 / isolate v23.1.3 / race Av1-4-5-6-7-8) TaxID=985895 RepID=E5A7P2_LEPMJ|nr:predicted protein [Plenodomus lingam JN3]CBX99637.1 predicted protein [Plenodomus lingam JN3]
MCHVASKGTFKKQTNSPLQATRSPVIPSHIINVKHAGCGC